MLDLKLPGACQTSISVVVDSLVTTRAWVACRCCAPTAARRRDRRSIPPAASGAPGRCRSTATTMFGFPTSRRAGGITRLCGARTETCPPGMKTGDAISPPGGYNGGGMQLLVDVSIDPAGNVWVSNNWQDPGSCYSNVGGGSFDPLWRPGNDGVLRHGQAGACAADRTGKTTVGAIQRCLLAGQTRPETLLRAESAFPTITDIVDYGRDLRHGMDVI